MVIKNKSGWLRIVEAVIAILMVASVLLIVLARQNINPDKGEEIYETQKAVLERISENNELRQMVLNDDEVEIEEFIKDKGMLDEWLEFDIEICEVDAMCGLEIDDNEDEDEDYVESLGADKEIYSHEIIISSTLQEYKPKKLKIFVWEK